MLWRAAFGDSTHGWVVGRWGAILATADAGRTWVRQFSQEHVVFGSIAAVDARHAWAVGRLHYQPVIMATSDGGRSWRRQRIKGVTWLIGVAFSDAQHGWVTGLNEDSGKGIIFATSDGGGHWRRQWQQRSTWLGQVACVDDQHVWIVGGPTQYPVSSIPQTPPLILATTDGGRHWRTQIAADAQTESDLVDVSFVDIRHGWAVGHDSVLETVNGGKTWEPLPLPDKRLSPVAIAFGDRRHGWLVVNKQALMASSDGGETWTLIRPQRGGMLTDVAVWQANAH